MVTVFESNHYLHRMVFKWILNHDDLDDLTIDQFMTKYGIDHNNRGQLLIPDDLLPVILLESNESGHSELVANSETNFPVIITNKHFCNALSQMFTRMAMSIEPWQDRYPGFVALRNKYDISLDVSKYGLDSIILPLRLYDLVRWANKTNFDKNWKNFND